VLNWPAKVRLEALSAHLPLQRFRIAIAMQRDRRKRVVYTGKIG
jgi:hypothetical protein